MLTDEFSVRVVSEIAAIEPRIWDALANPLQGGPPQPKGERFNPFLTHAFLHALEASKCVGARSGWTPAHIVVESGGRIVAAAAAYLKAHSQGEYVFDHGWAQAYEQAGGRYYPKLQIAVPFTPVTGRRLLVAADAPKGAREALIAGLKAARKTLRASSTHVTFPEAEDSEALAQAGFLTRVGEQFHFINEGCADFDDFLGSLASRKRKAVKRERREALGDDVEIDRLTGADLKPAHWDAFFEFYMDTGSRKWGRPYLNREFFTRIGESLADRVLLVMARRGDRYIAGAINFIGDDALYGRNWGMIEHRPFLHFEVCYHQAIEFALARGLSRVEAGAQGEHKLARGYRPVPTYSAHEFADAGMARAVGDYVIRERRAIEASMAMYEEHLPFRQAEQEAD